MDKYHDLNCPYCHKPAELVDGRTIYPHRKDLHHKAFWRCDPCGAYVGCHPGTIEPLGRLADAKLRALKMKVHALFDPMWRSKRVKRNVAYKWLASELGISQKECHIGMFDDARAAEALSILESGRRPWTAVEVVAQCSSDRGEQ